MPYSPEMHKYKQMPKSCSEIAAQKASTHRRSVPLHPHKVARTEGGLRYLVRTMRRSPSPSAI